MVQELLGRDHPRVGFCYDMGFVLEPYIRKERLPHWLVGEDYIRPLVGLNVSGLLAMGGYTQKNMFGLRSDYRHLIHELMKYFVEKHNARIMLVPHVVGTGEGSESDVVACREIYREAESGIRVHLHLLEESYDQHELKAIIGRCDFFLGSRMHACIAALSQCVPAVGLAYSRKFRGVFGPVGVEELVIDLREHDEASIITLVGRGFDRRLSLRAQLEAKMPSVRASVLNLFSQF